MIRKLTIVSIFFFAHIPRAEAVLCLVHTSDPRYHVASYIRNQVSCKSPFPYVSPAELAGKLVVSITAISLIFKLFDYIQSEDKKEQFVNSLKLDTNSKFYQCGEVDVITSNGKAFVGLNKEFLELDYFSPTAYRKTEVEGIIQFDLEKNMILGQKWKEKTARGTRCEYKGLLAAQ